MRSWSDWIEMAKIRQPSRIEQAHHAQWIEAAVALGFPLERPPCPHLSPEEYDQVIANEEDHRDEIEAQRQDEDDADE